MKLSYVLPLAALSTAFVLPDERVISQIAIEAHKSAGSAFDRLTSKDQVVENFEHSVEKLADIYDKVAKSSKHALDTAIDYAAATGSDISKKVQQTGFDASSWIDSTTNIGSHGHHDPPNQTVYELIATSKYTTKLAAAISEYPDLVTLLNGTLANYTVFAPVDSAFEKIPEDAPKPSKEFLKKALLYHVSPEFYPAQKVLVTHTVPTALTVDTVGIGPQRLSTNIGLKGLTVNFYSRIIAINIVSQLFLSLAISSTDQQKFGTNGVIHGLDSLLVPPPNAAEIITFLPGQFSTLELGLTKTGLLAAINDTASHYGGTLFAPSNFAFQKLPAKITGFLFSSYGTKYLKALLQYHVVANQTLYSDAYYAADSVDENSIPKGIFHIDLPTLLEGKSLAVDVARYGRLIEIKVNAFARVDIEDGIAADGVIQVVSDVLIPPKRIDRMEKHCQHEELTVEELKDRLEPFIDDVEL
ncbi:MAG: hypothetical protein LQ343_000742 [Gyalolechia ehrenbergii]|nr:MAG: hypothetical protein LQ343_000742 [Gyalolechia ehrenbergii]